MITWKVDEQTADFILKALAQRPYVEVHLLIQELMRQAQPVLPSPPVEVSQPLA